MNHHRQQSQPPPPSRPPERGLIHNPNHQQPSQQRSSFPTFPPPPVSQAPVHVPFSADPFSRRDPFINSDQHNRRESLGHQNRESGASSSSERGGWINNAGKPRNNTACTFLQLPNFCACFPLRHESTIAITLCAKHRRCYPSRLDIANVLPFSTFTLPPSHYAIVAKVLGVRRRFSPLWNLRRRLRRPKCILVK